MSNCTSAVESFSSIENNAVKSNAESGAAFSSSAGESMHMHSAIKDSIQGTAKSHLPNLELDNQSSSIHEENGAKGRGLTKEAEPKHGGANEKCFDLDKFEKNKAKQSEPKSEAPKDGGDKLELHLLKQN
jgi:hypothetical protein